MFRRTWAVLLAALILMLGSAVSATAGPHGTDRPFRAAASGQINFDFTNPRGCLLPDSQRSHKPPARRLTWGPSGSTRRTASAMARARACPTTA